MPANIVQIKTPRKSLFCPICGEEVLKGSSHDAVYCDHVMFIYFDDAETFTYKNPNIRSHIDDVLNELKADDAPMKALFDVIASVDHSLSSEMMFQQLKEHQSHPVELLMSQRIKSSLLALSIERARIIPNTKLSTIHVGFDFDVL